MKKKILTPQFETNFLAEVSVVYSKKVKSTDMPQIGGSSDVYENLLKVWNNNTIDFQEEFVVMFLTRQNRIVGTAKISMGGFAGTVCDPKVIFTMALQTGCSSIILSHNHPSGNLKPSHADIQMTRKMCEAGKVLDIQVLDHVIVTSEGYFSFLDEGMI